jgi:hypothetical protein
VRKDASSDFDCLSEDDRHELSRWNARRSMLVQKRIQDEIDAKLEELDCCLEESVPFVKLLVTDRSEGAVSGASQFAERAVLTIWRPTNAQLDLLQEGSLVRIKNLGVKSERFDGLLQFSCGSSTPMSSIPSIDANQSLEGLPWHSYTSLLRAHLQTKRCWNESSNDRCVLNVLGVVLKVEMLDDNQGWNIFLTDESRLLLCVYCDKEIHQKSPAAMVLNSSGKPAIAGFSNLRATLFDYTECCAVAQFDGLSHVQIEPRCQQATRLADWVQSDMGCVELKKLTLYLNSGIHGSGLPGSSATRAIGYISGFHYSYTHTRLLVMVDCGGSYIHTFKLPLDLLPVITVLCPDLEEYVALHVEGESLLSNLPVIGRVLRARQTMFSFTVHSMSTAPLDFPGCVMEVSHVSAVDTNALAALYSCLLTYD